MTHHSRWISLLNRLLPFRGGQETALFHSASFELQEATKALDNEEKRIYHLKRAEVVIKKLERSPLDTAMSHIKPRGVKFLNLQRKA